MDWINDASTAITAISIVASIIAVATNYKRIMRAFVYRHIRKILNIKDGDKVLVVCSELPEPEKRQLVEDREFIYLMKYGDLDGWVELIFSLLRIYPNIDLQIMSSGEALNARVDLGHQILLIGGPDYNLLVRRIHDMGVHRLGYQVEASTPGQEEIVLEDRVSKKRYWFEHIDKDFGYIERMQSPFDHSKQVIFFGGCHTVGVTAATKFLSAFSEGRRHVSKKTLINAHALAKALPSNSEEFTLLISASKIGASIASPSYREAELFIGKRDKPEEMSHPTSRLKK